MKKIDNYALSAAWIGWILGLTLVAMADVAFLTRNHFAVEDIIFTSIITAFYLGMSYFIYRFMIKPNREAFQPWVDWMNSR
jgi:hypothetical protein